MTSLTLQSKADAQALALQNILSPVFDDYDAFFGNKIAESFERGNLYGCSECFALRYRVIASIPNEDVPRFMLQINKALRAGKVSLKGGEGHKLVGIVRQFPVSSGEEWPQALAFRQENVTAEHTIFYIQIEDFGASRVFPLEYID